MTTAAAAGGAVVAVLVVTLQILHFACPLAVARVKATTSIEAEVVAFGMGQRWSVAIVTAGRVRFCMT